MQKPLLPLLLFLAATVMLSFGHCLSSAEQIGSSRITYDLRVNPHRGPVRIAPSPMSLPGQAHHLEDCAIGDYLVARLRIAERRRQVAA